MRILIAFILWGLVSSVSAEQAPSSWTNEWPNTDFANSSVLFEEILSGGPPKDGIPALDEVSFVKAVRVNIPDEEPVITVELAGQTPRAYPIRYLTWHEIVNDRIGDTPITVTFCPLCNSAIVFDGHLKGSTLTFGVSGKLRHSDMVMYDRQTESWWQQFTGEAIVGEMTGAKLSTIPSWMESFEAFRTRNPNGLIMAEPTGAARPYGSNPYAGYDSSKTPFLYNGEMPPHNIPPLARVVRVGNRAWPLERVRTAADITEGGVRILWAAGQASALDKRSIAQSRDVGNIRVFDARTGEPVVHEVVFAFAFHAFEPNGTWFVGN